jgi:hypothetical protein
MRASRAAARVVLITMLMTGGTSRPLRGQSGSVETGTAPALVNPEIKAVTLEPPPKIDGALDDPAWQTAPEVTGLTHERNQPAEETRVRVGHDATHLYFAFRCLDREPGSIRALQTKRNGDMESDDTVIVGLNPLADRRTMYWFTVNARGTQQEEIPGGAAAKIEWRGDWRGAAKVDRDCWTAEMAIPFEILRYPRGQKRFGLLLRRHLGRIDQTSDWPPGTNYHTRDNMAFVVDLEAPHFRRRPLIMPYALTGAGQDAHYSTGLDLKYSGENNVTGLFTLRPDFRTVEDVIDTVDFSYNPRQLSDRRPFFAEGSGYFDDSRMFYSRSIGEVDTGLKLFGKIGSLGFGGMNATRFGHTTDSLMNLQYDFSRYSDGSFALAYHRGDGIGNSVARFSYHWFRPQRVSNRDFSVNVYKSLSQGAGGDGTYYSFSVDNWGGRDELGWHINLRQIDPDFEPALGYVPEKDLRSVGGWLDWSHEFKKGPLLSWDWNMEYDQTWRQDGSLFHHGISPGIGTTFRNNTRLGLGYDLSNRPPYRDRIANLNYRWNIRDFYRSGNVQYRFGRQAGGDYQFLNVGQGFRLSEKLSTRVGVEMLRLDYDRGEDDNRSQLVTTGIYEISPERGVVLRLVGSDEGFNAYAAYRQELRRGADIFFILGDPNARSFTRRASLKIVRAYQ